MTDRPVLDAVFFFFSFSLFVGIVSRLSLSHVRVFFLPRSYLSIHVIICVFLSVIQNTFYGGVQV